MIFTDQKVIFIHIPKTGGNYFSHCFVDQSDDKKIVKSGVQDGLDLFAVEGKLTKSKHQPLSDYVELLGPEIANYSVFFVKRHPVERLISFYYSRHRWVSKTDAGQITVPKVENPIDLKRFSSLVENQASIFQLLDLTNVELSSAPDFIGMHRSGARIYALDFANLGSEIARFATKFGFNLANQPARKINSSVAAKPLDINAKQMHLIKDIVLNSKHAEDLIIF